MQYTIAIVVVAICGAIFLGDGYFRTRRAEQKTAHVRSDLAAMSIQELSVRSKECDDSRAGRDAVNRDSGYCEAVWREMEARPLQIIDAPAAERP